MNDKMKRFLTSIHIEDIERFDIDFEMLSRNRFNNKQLDMVIVKQTPWTYELLREFQDGLDTITYPYHIMFSYINRPTCLDAINLFADWYQYLYRIPSTFKFDYQGDYKIIALFKNKEELDKGTNVLNEFSDFLNFLTYEFVITKEIREDNEPAYTKRQINKINKEANKEANDAIENSEKEPEILDSSEVSKIIEKEQKEQQQNIEDMLLKSMQDNYKRMLKDRERARLNKRGNYTPIDLIDSIDANSDHVDIEAKVFSCELRKFGERSRLTLGIYDRAMGAIYVNMALNNQVTEEFVGQLTKDTNVRVRGVAHIDDFSKTLQIKGHYIDLLPPDEPRIDECEEKRVELHLHSQMSVQDGVSSMEKYCRVASLMGHKSISITDHGVVQGYPEAQKYADKYKIKMNYGSELYMVDDKLTYVFNPHDIPLNKAKYVVLDLETTGLSPRYNRIIEFGAVKVEHGMVTGSIDLLINPKIEVSSKITEITDITNEMLKNKPTIKEALPKIIEFIGDAVIVTHNASFDFTFIQEALANNGYPRLTNSVIDTLSLSRYLFPDSRSHRLGALCRNLDVLYDEEKAHRADYDANVLNNVWQPMLALLTKDNYHLTDTMLNDLETPKSLLKHIKPYHVTVLAKNKIGLKNLYKLISLSHTEYFAEVPKIPRREVEKLREGLLLGSSCFNGEVFQTAKTSNQEKLNEVIKFYDFIEVQPPENYSYLVNMDEVTDEEELLCFLKDIISEADNLNKITVATGDVHYCDPEDKIYRDVYISAKAVGGINHALSPYGRSKRQPFENPDQHYRTTKEMLEAFSFIDEQKAYEIVVTNTNKIDSMIEPLKPLPNDKLYTPKIENCEQLLSQMCFDKAHELYGEVLPEYIENRLNTELHGIISNGFSVIYYIAHKIIKKANEDGYIVGSRGSVGSSFVATMADITEVNPLPPHYRCPNCKHFEFSKEEHPDIKSGYDLPMKKCPHCGTIMIGDGQDIPFETFLGFKAEKTPDIDLNFPGDYQARAHEYTKELLGSENVFRAGTIETVAEKTAFGFARGYLERMGYDLSTYPRAKIALLASGCVDVKRTTGQHPGGIVVIPSDYEVYDFTPIQYPADEVNAAWRTTHFDFRSIHDTVLKLDLLGHVDPVALKMMCDMTGIDVKNIPLNDSKVLSLFSSPKVLKMKHNYLAQKTGAMGIPEFGTDFVRGILESTKPTTFSDLVVISGLSHGTGVWNGNAEKLIDNGTCTLKEVIGCRDDIMTYLISKGLPSNVAFSIMEDVRKGKGLKETYVETMLVNKVPQWYIDSCNAIEYMFPKGHATAYVMMAIRVGYFKIYYPLEYYATFFSVRSKQYDIETMIKGESAIISRFDGLKLKSRTKGEEVSPKEHEIMKTLQIAVEMVQRGYSFANINLYKSDATRFVVDHEKQQLIPPFITIDGLGESAAYSVIEARKNGEFLSKEDLLRRTKLNGTNVELLDKLGVLDGMSESDQLSLFDF